MKVSNSIVQHYLNLNDEMMTVEQMADMLHISKWGVLKRIERGMIPAHKNGRRWYILKSELMKEIRSNNPSNF